MPELSFSREDIIYTHEDDIFRQHKGGVISDLSVVNNPDSTDAQGKVAAYTRSGTGGAYVRIDCFEGPEGTLPADRLNAAVITGNVPEIFYALKIRVKTPGTAVPTNGFTAWLRMFDQTTGTNVARFTLTNVSGTIRDSVFVYSPAEVFNAAGSANYDEWNIYGVHWKASSGASDGILRVYKKSLESDPWGTPIIDVDDHNSTAEVSGLHWGCNASGAAGHLGQPTF